MGFINVGKENTDSINLYYEDHGSGKPIVMIHGFPLSGRSWEKQRMALVREGYRVITYDRRGFGQSSQPAFGYDYDTFASDLNQLMTKLDLRDATLMGFSMGGGEVARYIGKYGSDRLSKAAILSGVTPYLLKSSDNPGALDENGVRGMQQTIAKDRFAYLTAFFKDFYNLDKFLGNRISEDVVHDSWNIASMASPRGTYDCPQSWIEDFRKDVASINVPTLVMQGDSDRILPLAATGARTHEAIKGSQYVVLEGAPHGMLWTHADQVNKTLVDFCAGRAVSTQTAKAAAAR